VTTLRGKLVVLYVSAAVTVQINVTLLSRSVAVSSSNMSQKLQTLRTALFWFITQRAVVIYCRRFGTTSLSLHQDFHPLLLPVGH
jgi:hypothetical protein